MKAERAGVNLFPTSAFCLIAIFIGGFNLTSAAQTFSDANWSSLGPGMNGSVRAIAVSGTNVYAGGLFTKAGGVTVSHVAKWNGSTWSALGSGIDGSVFALAVSGTNLYAAGIFATASGVTANKVARWNGSSWSAMGSGMNGYYVNALAVSGTNLYAGGSFTMAGFSTAYEVAVWNGTSWSGLAFGATLDNTVYSLAVSGNNLYAGGDFTRANSSITVNSIARWDGSFWSALGTGMGGTDLNSVYSIVIAGTNVYAGGLFTSAGNSYAGDLAMWNGSHWSCPGWFGAGTNYYPSLYALALSDSELYAGGDFTSATGIPANHIAKSSGTNWFPLGSGVNGTVRALAVSGNDLYVGGDFTTAGNKSTPYIARAYVSALPTLSITQSAGNVTISWPSTNTGFLLEQSTSLISPNTWVSNADSISDDGTSKWVTVPAINSAQFYRLRRP